MIITTSLTKKNRINIYADGEYTFTVPCLLWQMSGIKEGQAVSDEILQQLKEQGLQEDAYQKALSLLSYRAHASFELYRKLLVKYPANAASFAIEKCKENLLINDEAYACDLAEELFRRKSFSPKRIYSELLRRGIDRETSDIAVKSLTVDTEQDIQRALDKLHYTREANEKETAKVIRRLLNMGYSLSDIRRCIKNIPYDEE